MRKKELSHLIFFILDLGEYFIRKYTHKTVIKIAKHGVKNFNIFSPSFEILDN